MIDTKEDDLRFSHLKKWNITHVKRPLISVDTLGFNNAILQNFKLEDWQRNKPIKDIKQSSKEIVTA